MSVLQTARYGHNYAKSARFAKQSEAAPKAECQSIGLPGGESRRGNVRNGQSGKSEAAVSLHVSLLGITGIRIWLGCIPYAQKVLGDGGWDLVLSNFFRGLFPALVVAVLLGRALSKKSLSILNVACTGTLVVLGCLLWFNQDSSSPLIVSVASMAAGWLYIQWGEVYARLSLSEAMIHVCLSLAIAGCGVIALSFLPDLLIGALLVALPLAGCLMYAIALDKFCGADNPLPAKRQPALSLKGDGKWAISLAIYAVLWGIMQALPFGFIAERDSLYHIVYRLGGAVLVLLPIAWVRLLKRNFNLLYIWYLITGAAAVSFLMILIAGDALSGVALTLFAVGNYSVLAYWWVRCVDFSQRSNRPAYAIFAIGWFILLTGISLGEVIAKWISTLGNSEVLLVSLGVFLIVSYLMVLLHPEKGPVEATASPQVIADTPGPAESRDVMEQTIERASADYHFTKRERDLMLLICHGHTLQYASDELGISLNTARGHIKRIYAKMDVHSKEEMLVILRRYGDGSDT